MEPAEMNLVELKTRLSSSFKDRFILEGELGAGAFGLVVKAQQVALNRQVAIKFLLNKQARHLEALKRFKREAQTLANLRHPNIVQVFEFGKDSGIAFLVEELLDGCSLREYLSEFVSLSADESIKIVKALAKGLSLAHQNGIVHRDVKPANVFICHNEYKLVDFGLVSTVTDETQITATNAVIGSPAYMAPEQFLGAEPSPSLDIYALGELLFEMIAGCPPFSANDCGALLTQKLNENAPPLNKIAKCELPEGLADLVGSLLERRVDRRPTDCEELIGLLDDVASGRGYRSATVMERDKKIVQRKPVKWLLILPLLATLLTLTCYLHQSQPNKVAIGKTEPEFKVTKCASTWCQIHISSQKLAYLSVQVAQRNKADSIKLQQVRGQRWRLLLTDLQPDTKYLITASFATPQSTVQRVVMAICTKGIEKTILHQFNHLSHEKSPIFRPTIKGSKLILARPNSPLCSFDLEKHNLETFSSKTIQGAAFSWQDRVIVLEDGIHLNCFDLEGNERWNTKLAKKCHLDPLFVENSVLFHFQKNGFTSVNMLTGLVEWAVDDSFMAYPWTLSGKIILHQDEFLKGSFVCAMTGKRLKLKTFYPLGSTLDAVAALEKTFAVATDAQRFYVGKPGFAPIVEKILPGSCHNLLPFEGSILCHIKNLKQFISVDSQSGHIHWRQELPAKDIIFLSFHTLAIGLSRESLITVNPVTGSLGEKILVNANWIFGLHQWKQHLIYLEGNKLCLLKDLFPPVPNSRLLTTSQFRELPLPKNKRTRVHSYRPRNH